MAGLPTVSVVVATHQRRPLLEGLLDALGSQCWDGPPPEILVVDDGSSDGTWDLLSDRKDLTALRLERAGGPAAARNRGWRAAKGEVIVFTDDDCRPSPTWLAELVGALVGADADLAQGVTRPEPDEWDGSGPFARTMWVLEEDGFYATCNMAYRRSVLERLGGFDERFRRPFGEDTDLAWRALEAGSAAVFAPDAVVHHHVWPSDYRAHLRDRVRREGIVMAAAQHPQIRARFHRPRWYQASHPKAVAALAGVTLGAAVVSAASGRGRSGRPGPAGIFSRLGGLAAAGALAAPYVRYRMVERRLPCRPRNLPAVIALAWVADLVEVGVLAAASARYRTLLL